MKELFKLCWPPDSSVMGGTITGLVICRLWLEDWLFDERIPVAVYIFLFILNVFLLTGYFRRKKTNRKINGKKTESKGKDEGH